MWRVFQRERDGTTSSIAVAESVLDNPEGGAGTWRYILRWPLEAPGEHGMGEAVESDAISPVEESLWEALDDVGGEPVARIRGDGWWTLVARGGPGLPWELLAEIASGELGRAAHIEEGDDEDGSWLRENVLPDARERSWMDSAEVVGQLVLLGVDLDEPTRVRHHVFAPDGGDLEAFAETAPGGPWDLEVIEPDPEQAIPPGIVLSHLVEPRLATLQPIVWSLTRHAQAAGLYYDGWEAGVDEHGGSLFDALMTAAETGEA